MSHLCKLLVSKHTYYLHSCIIFSGMNFSIFLGSCLNMSNQVSIIWHCKIHCFPFCFPQDQHLSMLEYHVPVTAGGVANIFDLLETNKTALNITNFLVSQTTLEEVSWTPWSRGTSLPILFISFQWHSIYF